MRLPWSKKEEPEAEQYGGTDRAIADAIAAHEAQYNALAAMAQQAAYQHAAVGSPYTVRPTAVTVASDLPASRLFKMIEENPVYGMRFAAVMGEIAKKLEEKDAEIAALQKRLAPYEEDVLNF